MQLLSVLARSKIQRGFSEYGHAKSFPLGRAASGGGEGEKVEGQSAHFAEEAGVHIFQAEPSAEAR